MKEKLKGSALALLIGALGGGAGTALALKGGKVDPRYHVHGLDLRRPVGADGGVTVTAYGTVKLELADGGTDATDLGGKPCDLPAPALVTLMNAAAACLP